MDDSDGEAGSNNHNIIFEIEARPAFSTEIAGCAFLFCQPAALRR